MTAGTPSLPSGTRAPAPGDDAPAAVALLGTTASGKSSIAMAAARRLGDVEILCVDSMTVYRGMDLATAKPSAAERAAVPHHLLDLVDPSEEFTVRRFQGAAWRALDDVARRGGRPLLVGGTGLYLRAVVDALEIPGRFPEVAAELEREADAPGGVERLHARLAELDPLAASRTTSSNRRRVVRALEVTLGSGRPFSTYGPGLATYPPSRVEMVGLSFEASSVDARIEERFRRWLDEGLVEEVRALASSPRGLSLSARQALGYKELLAHVTGTASLDECTAEAVRRTRSFARRQWSWFRRDPRIRWVRPGEDPVAVVAEALGRIPRRRASARGGARAPEPAGCETVKMLEGAGNGTPGSVLALSKHEAAGNDFLVLVDPGGAWQLSGWQVRALCDRRLGVGADGLLVVRPARTDAADVEMTLHNADGSAAEMSGNGVRCLVQAAIASGLASAGRVRVATAAGLREVEYTETGPSEGDAQVDMGRVRLGREVSSPLPGTGARLADVGNPHLVIAGGADLDLDGLDLGSLGAAGVALAGEPVNVEVIRPGPEPGSLSLRVFERGVGETAACGTGSSAAAAAARAFGLIDGGHVVVHNPGGRLEVRLGPTDDDSVVLGGPVRHVADVIVDPRLLARVRGPGAPVAAASER